MAHGTAVDKVTHMIMAVAARGEYTWDPVKKKAAFRLSQDMDWKKDVLYIAGTHYYVNYKIQEKMAHHFSVGRKVGELFKAVDNDGVMKTRPYFTLWRVADIAAVLAWLEFGKAAKEVVKSKAFPDPVDRDNDYLVASHAIVRSILKGCYSSESSAFNVQSFDFLNRDIADFPAAPPDTGEDGHTPSPFIEIRSVQRKDREQNVEQPGNSYADDSDSDSDSDSDHLYIYEDEDDEKEEENISSEEDIDERIRNIIKDSGIDSDAYFKVDGEEEQQEEEEEYEEEEEEEDESEASSRYSDTHDIEKRASFAKVP